MKKILLHISFLLFLVFFLTGCSEKKLESISLNVDSLISINETAEVKVSFDPKEVEEDITWATSNEAIASVNNGIITAKGIGNATITATTTSGITKQVNIEVYQKIESITIDKQNVEMFVGDTSQITAVIKPDDATYKDITWTSTNHNVATVEDGVITAKEIGKTNIIATTKDGLFQKCSVIVKEKPIEFSGKGDKIISNINIPKGVYKAVLSNSGAHNFIVEVYDEYGNSDLLANEIGSYNGQATFVTNGESKYYFSVISSGNWAISWK